MPINTTEIQSLLRPGLKSVLSTYDMYPAQWPDIFKTYPSDKAVELDVEMKMLGLAQIRAEGAPTAVDDMGQRIVTSYIHRYVALSFAITRQAMMDNLYEDKFPMMAEALKDSLAQSKDVLGASVLNNGFDPAFPIGDGQPLYSLNHPIDTGVVANMPAVPAQLNEASLESAINTIQQYQNQAGLVVQTKAMRLVVPTQLQWTSDRLLESEFRTNTANNDRSAIYNVSAIPQGYKVNQYLTSPTAWFIITNAPEGFKHFVREKVTTSVYTDFSTDNLLCKAVERYSFGNSNFRSTYGSAGS